MMEGTAEARTQDLLIRYTCGCGVVLLFNQASTTKVCPGCGAWFCMRVTVGETLKGEDHV
jgi:predicted RNA-binding Zn-ribbon protein involved in translation (DUF1610 family)